MTEFQAKHVTYPLATAAKGAIFACLMMTVSATAAQAQSKHKNRTYAHLGKPKVVWSAPAKRRSVSIPIYINLGPTVAAPRRRTFNHRVVYRRYGPPIYGYGFYYSDAEAARYLAFSNLSLALLDRLEEQQVRYHEQAQIDATSAPLGETIVWSNGSASGSATPIREGIDATGNQCREFQQSITVDGNVEEAYGVACQSPDGTWQIMAH